MKIFILPNKSKNFSKVKKKYLFHRKMSNLDYSYHQLFQDKEKIINFFDLKREVPIEELIYSFYYVFVERRSFYRNEKYELFKKFWKAPYIPMLRLKKKDEKYPKKEWCPLRKLEYIFSNIEKLINIEETLFDYDTVLKFIRHFTTQPLYYEEALASILQKNKRDGLIQFWRNTLNTIFSLPFKNKKWVEDELPLIYEMEFNTNYLFSQFGYVLSELDVISFSSFGYRYSFELIRPLNFASENWWNVNKIILSKLFEISVETNPISFAIHFLKVFWKLSNSLSYYFTKMTKIYPHLNSEEKKSLLSNFNHWIKENISTDSPFEILHKMYEVYPLVVREKDFFYFLFENLSFENKSLLIRAYEFSLVVDLGIGVDMEKYLFYSLLKDNIFLRKYLLKIISRLDGGESGYYMDSHLRFVGDVTFSLNRGVYHLLGLCTNKKARKKWIGSKILEENEKVKEIIILDDKRVLFFVLKIIFSKKVKY